MPRKPYPAPLVIAPLSEAHTHTIISLHGRGSNAERFGHELLASANLQARLPTVKFVFPTASKRRSTILKKIPIHQWYDNYSLEDPGQRTDLQIDGLCETAEFIRGLITEEARILGEGGYRKVILWGLSQGCAAGVFTLLGGWSDITEAKTLGAFIGMSGWLPFERQLHEILQCDDLLASVGDTSHDETQPDDRVITSDEESEPNEFSESDLEEDPFQRSSPLRDGFNPFTEEEDEEEKEETPLPIQAVDYVRDILDLPMISTNERSSENRPPLSNLCQLQTPVFIGHGSEDPKVSVRLGEKMSRVLSAGLGMNVTWKSYQGLGHWYRVEDEIQDILKFLESHVELPVEDESPVPGT
ncbi:Alpha/Beta hydrolase protein [Aspergillus coremiiformis]|uniref:Alpha/Beta hydrolase protein n=1 Tax=Aspergillus coremiiformis TaxID=138285 RepID=A0A5N6Z9S1_9EURO|nr:Alpha/Beta hydrolase protein [Aspergillus coremiiformis]